MLHVFIINPTAGKFNQSDVLIEEIKTIFNKDVLNKNSTHDLNCSNDVIIEITQSIGDATRIAKKFGELGTQTVLYACGGDGTLNEVVNGMLGFDNLALAPIPTGSGNDFIRAFGENHKKDFRDIKGLVEGNTTSIDLLMVSGKACLNIASAGFDSDVARNMVKFKNLPFVSGQMSYILSLMYCFCKCIKSKLEMEIDGVLRNTSDYIFAVCANGKCYGGGFKAAPYSDMHDGLIDFIAVPKVSRLKFLTLVNTYKKGEHFEKTDFIKLVRCKKVTLRADNELYMNIDGEIIPMKNPEISILPKAIKLIVPKSVTISADIISPNIVCKKEYAY